MKKGLWLILLISLICLVLLDIYYQHERTITNYHDYHDTITVEERETIVIRDTIRISQPVPSYIYRHKTDTVIKYLQDSTEVIPFEEKVYQDSNYTAVVSGYKPSLDSLSFTIPSKIVTVEKTQNIYHKKPFTFGIQLGIGYGITTRKPDIYIGLGGQYNF